MNKLTLNLLLATSGMLASSVIASAVEEIYNYDDQGNYTFVKSGDASGLPFAANEDIKSVTVEKDVHITYRGSIAPYGTLILNHNTSFTIRNSAFQEGWDFKATGGILVNSGSARVDAEGGIIFESGSTTTINGHLAIGSVGTMFVNFNEGSKINLNLSTAVGDLAILDILTKTVTEAQNEVVLEGATITLSNAGAGDYKLIKVEDKYVGAVEKAGFVLEDGTELKIGENGLAWGESVDGYSTLIYSSTIPEPSAFGLLAGLGALALVVSRRRRARKIA